MQPKCSFNVFYEGRNNLFDIRRGQDDRILDIVTRHMKAAQVKWGRLSPSELSEIHTKDQLVAKVKERYNVPHKHRPTTSSDGFRTSNSEPRPFI